MDHSMTDFLCLPKECVFTILEFCDPPQRFRCIFLSKYLRQMLTSDESFLWRLQRLHVERGIHHPPTLTNPEKQTWKSIYLENREKRFLWFSGDYEDDSWSGRKKKRRGTKENTSNGGRSRNHHISVTLRFKPRSADNNHQRSMTTDMNEPNTDDVGRKSIGGSLGKVSLPLHQRLALVRIANNLSSNREALQKLREGGEWFGKQQQQFEKSKENEEGGVVQLKGKGEETKSDKYDDEDTIVPGGITSGIQSIDYENNCVVCLDSNRGLYEVSFENVLGDDCSQRTLYEKTTMGAVSDLFNGVNGACLVYGQTGSGKTYTMFGGGSSVSGVPGIVPRLCSDVLRTIDDRRQRLCLRPRPRSKKNRLSVSIDASLRVSYIEIYGEEVCDLLRDGAPCGTSTVASHRYVLNGRADVPVSTQEEMDAVLARGEAQKRVGATAMNERSSRAHTLLILTLVQRASMSSKDGTATDPFSPVTVTSRLFLADLGGSEQLKKADLGGVDHDLFVADPQRQQRQRVAEAVRINLGLLALKQCVKALRARKKFVPYTDSKLTLLLAPGLGGGGNGNDIHHNGKSHTTVIACASQSAENQSETLGTIQFGQACGRIKIYVRGGRGISNNDSDNAYLRRMLEAMVRRIDAEIERCEASVRKKERWESRVLRRIDSCGEEEVKVTSVLCGAEREREHLEILLLKRAELMGTTTTTEQRPCNSSDTLSTTTVLTKIFQAPSSPDPTKTTPPPYQRMN